MTPLQQRGAAIVRRLPRNAKMAEVGVLLGALSEYVLRNSNAHVVMVDNWQTADKQPAAYRATRDAHANHTDTWRVDAHKAEAMKRAAMFPGRAFIREGWSTDIAAYIPDGSLDLVFLDADHSYDGVRADIEAWLPKVRNGGWIGGHDYGNGDPAYDFSGVKRAVDEAFPEGVELDDNYTWFRRVD